MIILIVFLVLYCMVEAIHKFYVEKDVDKHSDIMSPERRAWHRWAFIQAGLILTFLCVCILFKLRFDDVSVFVLIPSYFLIRGLAMDNFKNVLQGGLSHILYVEKENFIAGKGHWLAGKSGIPAEIVMLLLKLSLVALIIFIPKIESLFKP